MPLVELTPAEVPPLRTAVGDVQAAVARYYAMTARNGDLGTAVRGFLNAAQVVNDLLTNQVTNAADYRELFDRRTAPSLAALEVMEGVKYARNVVQHVLHIVRPKDDKVLVGGLHGLRVYTEWDEVPPAAHAQLTNPRTGALKASYDSALLDQEVVGTMLDTLHFFRDVNAALVHRDARGEWSGFPLMNQPGMLNRLHPEEPTDTRTAWDWLNDRRPNGDLRVVCAQITTAEARYLCGFTFVGRHSFSPFAETVEQVQHDLTAGMAYVEGDVWANVDDATAQFPSAQGAVWFSREDPDSWASTPADIDRKDDWCLGDTADVWAQVLRVEQVEPGLPLPVAYEIRRARRLNAYVPSRD